METGQCDLGVVSKYTVNLCFPTIMQKIIDIGSTEQTNDVLLDRTVHVLFFGTELSGRDRFYVKLRISLVIPGIYRNTSDVGWLSSSHPPKDATYVLKLHKTCVDGSRPEFISLLCCNVVVCNYTNIIYLA